jgi:uncharacterized protein DUF5684
MPLALMVLAQRGPEAGSALGLLIEIILIIVLIAAGWVIFAKAGRPGWAAIIPIYNTLVMLNIVGRPWWWLLLMLVPLLNIIIWIIVMNDLSSSFGHGIGFTLGLIFLAPIFGLILAFGGSEYRGAAAA